MPVADVEFNAGPLPTPFDPDAPAKMRRLIRSFADDPEAQYGEQVARLEDLIRSTDPRRLLTVMALEHAFFPVGFDAELRLPDALTQWPLEWLQGFYLRFELGDYTLGSDPDTATVREIGKRLAWIGTATEAVWFRQREERYGRESSEKIDGSWEQQQARIAQMAAETGATVRTWSPSRRGCANRSTAGRSASWDTACLGFPNCCSTSRKRPSGAPTACGKRCAP